MLPAAFNGDPKVRAAAIDHLTRALNARKITEGSLAWNGHEGSLAGALAQTADADAWQRQLGLPKWMANALDAVMQAFGDHDALQETIEVLGSIKPGQRLEAAGSTFVCRLLAEVAKDIHQQSAVANSIVEIVKLHYLRIQGEPVQSSAWRRARTVACRATDSEAPAEPDGSRPLTPEKAKLREVGMIAEAAAWDPLNSPSSMSDVLRHWIILQSLKSDEQLGWTQDDHAQVHEHLKEMHETYLAGKAPSSEGETVFSLLEKHRPEAFKRFKAYEEHDRASRIRYSKHLCELLTTLFSETVPTTLSIGPHSSRQ